MHFSAIAGSDHLIMHRHSGEPSLRTEQLIAQEDPNKACSHVICTDEITLRDFGLPPRSR